MTASGVPSSPRSSLPGQEASEGTKTRAIKRLGRYRLIAEIGRGGMATVYLALLQGPAGVQKLVVVKERRGDGEEPELDALFVDECRLAARFNHPNVVQVYEVGEEGDRMFIAMEYLEGQPLSRVRSRVPEDSLAPAHYARIFADVLAGLHYAHELRDYDGTPLHVVHRDVTPQNLFVTYEGHAKLVDFGIAKAAIASSQTKTGVLKGKVTYMSPEQARGDLLDRRSDIFAVGVMLWEVLAKRRMWKGLTEVAVLTRLVQGELPKLLDVAPSADPALAAICDKALAQKPVDRFQTAAEMQTALEGYAEQSGSRLREIGAVMTETFAEDRAKIREIVDRTLRDFRESSTELVRIDLDRVVPTPLGGSLEGSQPSVSRATQATAVSPVVAEPPARRPSPILFAAIALGVGALTAGVLVAARGPATTTIVTADPDAGGTPPAAAAQGASGKAEEQTVRLWVQGIPADAKVYLDGKRVGTGPYDGRIPRDTATHTLRLEAEGYEGLEEKIGATADVVLKLPMAKAKEEKEPKSGKRPPPEPVAKGRAEPSVGPTQPSAKPPGDLPDVRPPVRDLDHSDPYKKK